ncbi:hypothetical protein [Aestuariivivens sediminis]|uniref:hypothetical protein n=1 Tax=Aestuariivivens sediminis TaxID=2913557 RepID=UPI001F56180D|nr:hypothetical protein [Aestuariivivens sediminis]
MKAKKYFIAVAILGGLFFLAQTTTKDMEAAKVEKKAITNAMVAFKVEKKAITNAMVAFNVEKKAITNAMVA